MLIVRQVETPVISIELPSFQRTLWFFVTYELRFLFLGVTDI